MPCISLSPDFFGHSEKHGRTVQTKGQSLPPMGGVVDFINQHHVLRGGFRVPQFLGTCHFGVAATNRTPTRSALLPFRPFFSEPTRSGVVRRNGSATDRCGSKHWNLQFHLVRKNAVQQLKCDLGSLQHFWTRLRPIWPLKSLERETFSSHSEDGRSNQSGRCNIIFGTAGGRKFRKK